MVFHKGNVLSPILFNIYTNDQPVHDDARSFIYADDLCIATFENTKSTLSDIGEYYGRNHLRVNPEKIPTCVYHIRNRKPNHLMVQHTPTPTYLGVILDRTLIYNIHMANVKANTAERNNVLKKLSSSHGLKTQSPYEQHH